MAATTKTMASSLGGHSWVPGSSPSGAVLKTRPHPLSTSPTLDLCNDLLAQDTELRKDLVQDLHHWKENDRYRRERTYRTWQEEHFSKHQDDIAWQFQGPQYEIQRKKKMAHGAHYLDVTDRKGHVFLDSYAKEDGYDPFALSCQRPPKLQASSRGWKHDPLVRGQSEVSGTQDLRSSEMDAMLTNKMLFVTHPQRQLRPIGRHGTTWDHWNGMQRTHIDSYERHISQKKIQNPRNRSSGCAASLRDPPSK